MQGGEEETCPSATCLTNDLCGRSGELPSQHFTRLSETALFGTAAVSFGSLGWFVAPNGLDKDGITSVWPPVPFMTQALSCPATALLAT